MNSESRHAGGSSSAAEDGRLLARSGNPTRNAALGPGLHPLGLGGTRDGMVYVPKPHDVTRPVPLVLMLHGAGGIADQVVPLVQDAADRYDFIVLGTDSRARDTWDVIRGEYGPDVAFIDRALAYVFERFAIDPERIVVGGFSDGASYALCLGMMNGDLVSDVLAFSPGFTAPAQIRGRPRVFISHGDADTVLPVDRCGRRLARELSRAGYDVDYREFSGGHVVPPDLAKAAVERFLRL
jgi:phospholipase/carboxylesterase